MVGPSGDVAPVRRPKDRKAAILDVAAALFAERGFASVGIGDIAAGVGITGPAIYRHFAGKDALLDAVVEHAADGVALAVSAAPPSVDGVLGAAAGFVLDHPLLLAAYLRERGRLGTGSPELLAAERRIRRVWHAAAAAACPELDRQQLVLRQSGVVGAIAVAASGLGTVPRRRLEALLVESGSAVTRTPPTPEDPAVGHAAAWRPAPTKRDEVLAAALRLFRTRGFAGVGIDEIGAAAGISGPTVYHYYASKADLLLNAYDRAGERVTAGVHDALDGATSARDALERLARSYVGVAADSVDLIVVTSREGEGLPEAERPRLSRRRLLVREGWGGVVRELRPDLDEPAVRLLVRMVFGLVNAGAEVIEDQPGRRPDLVALVVALVLGSE